VECFKLWDRVQLSLPQIVVTEELFHVMDKGDQLDGESPEEEDMELEIM
jgi:hypothetical protein